MFLPDKKQIVESGGNSILKPNFVTFSGHRHKRFRAKPYGRGPVSYGFGWRSFLLERAVYQYKHHVTVLV